MQEGLGASVRRLKRSGATVRAFCTLMARIISFEVALSSSGTTIHVAREGSAMLGVGTGLCEPFHFNTLPLVLGKIHPRTCPWQGSARSLLFLGILPEK